MKNILLNGVLSFGLVVQLAAQQVIEYDTISKSLKSEIPYDAPFILKIPYDQKVDFVDYIKVKADREWHEEIRREFQKRKKTPGTSGYKRIDTKIGKIEKKIESLDSSNDRSLIEGKTQRLELLESRINLVINNAESEIRKEGSKTYLYITFDWSNTFDPNSEYAILLNTNEPEGLEVFKLYHEKGKWREKLEKLKKEQRQEYGFNWSIPSLEEVEEVYESKNLKALYEGVKSGERSTDSNSKKLSNPLVLKDAIKCITLDSLKQNCGLDCQSVNYLLALNKLDDSVLRKLSRGELGIASLKAKEATGLGKRGANLRSSIKILTPILQRLESLSIAGVCKISSLSEFSAFVQNLEKSNEYLEKSLEKQKKIEKIVFDGRFELPITLSGSTSVLNFQTRAKMRIIPDFGLISYGLQNDFVGFTPYLGFRINLRPVNKDIPWSKYPDKGLLHYTSVMVGWTLSTVAEENKREDLFGSRSFMTGIGVKLFSHSVMLNAGTLWFRKIDPNPVINSKSLAATPYLGVSVDLDLKDLLGGLGIKY